MNTDHQRERLHDFLENADPQRVAAMYAMVENELSTQSVLNDAGLQKKLERRRQEFENGAVMPVDAAQSKARIADLLKSRRK